LRPAEDTACGDAAETSLARGMTRRYLAQRLRLQQLRAIDAIAAQQSLTKASLLLGITQPALTHILKETEEVLQARLFERHARGVRPTRAGTAFIVTARRVLAELGRLDEELDALTCPTRGIVALGALPVAASGVLPGTLLRLKAQYPGIQVRLLQGRTEEMLVLLASGEIDLVVGRLYTPPRPDGFAREPMWTEPVSLLMRAGHPLLSSEAVSADALRRYDLLLPTVSQRVGQEVDHLLTRMGLEPERALRSSSYGLIREMLHASDSVAVIPRLMLIGDLLRGTLCVRDLPVEAPERPAGLILPRDRILPAAVQTFAACLRQQAPEIARKNLSRGSVPAPARARIVDGGVARP
jgi:LysR family pca operon transcriptional activator